MYTPDETVNVSAVSVWILQKPGLDTAEALEWMFTWDETIREEGDLDASDSAHAATRVYCAVVSICAGLKKTKAYIF